MSNEQQRKVVKILHTDLPVQSVTEQLVFEQFRDDVAELQYVFPNQDVMCLERENGTYYRIGEVNHLTVRYGEYMQGGYTGEEDEPGWMSCHSQFFYTSEVEKAIQCFVGRLKKESPQYPNLDVQGEKIESIGIHVSGFLYHRSHYDYLDEMLNPFWKQVFGKTAEEMWCGGIVVSHGDKAYGYRSKWDKAGVPYHHGVLLFLLTYTSELGETPKHESEQWVVDNYAKYFLKIQEAEREVLREVYKTQLGTEIKVDLKDESTSTEWVVYENNTPFQSYTSETQLGAVAAYLEDIKPKRIEHAKKLTELRNTY